jgi:hypothetical protein
MAHSPFDDHTNPLFVESRLATLQRPPPTPPQTPLRTFREVNALSTGSIVGQILAKMLLA